MSDLTYKYPDMESPILHNVDLHVEQGEFILMVGPSGSGKTTLLRCINGLIPHFYGGIISGKLMINQHNIYHYIEKGDRDALRFKKKLNVIIKII